MAVQLLELFGGIGAPRCALRNIGVRCKSIDYVEIDKKAVRSYNAMFKDDMEYCSQDVRDYNIRPDILVHGSPCQDFSIAGFRTGADEGSETRSSLMWETIKIIKSMGEWKPKVVIWENVRNVIAKNQIHNFQKYLDIMKELGYTSSYELLNTMDFGVPQKRKRLFTVSILGNEAFDFSNLIKTPCRPISDFLETDVPEYYNVTQPSMLKKMKRTTGNFIVPVIDTFAYTITTKQLRCPNSGVVALKGGGYRYLTERECWRLQGFTDKDYENALQANPSKKGLMNSVLYKQAGNSISVPVLESIFRKLILEEVSE